MELRFFAFHPHISLFLRIVIRFLPMEEHRSLKWRTKLHLWRTYAGFWRTKLHLWRSYAGLWRTNLHLWRSYAGLWRIKLHLWRSQTPFD